MLRQDFRIVQACKTEVASLMEAVTGAVDAASAAAAAESMRQVSAATIVRHADLAERARCHSIALLISHAAYANSRWSSTTSSEQLHITRF